MVALVAVLVAGMSSASAQSNDYTVELRLEGDRVVIELTEITVPVGALDINVYGLPPLAEPCELAGAVGACQQQEDGVLSVVAINPTGWQDPVVLIDAGLQSPGDPAVVGLVVDRGTDASGVDLVTDAFVGAPPSEEFLASQQPTAVQTPAPASDTATASTASPVTPTEDSGGGSTLPLLIGAGAALVVVVGGLALLRGGDDATSRSEAETD